MKSRKAFLLRISPALYEQIEAWAEAELRSVNGQIEYLLTEAVLRRAHLRDPRLQSGSSEYPRAEDAET